MSASLYKISEELNIIVSEIEEADGEMTDAQESLFAQLQNHLTNKTDSVVEYQKKRQDRIDAIDKRIKELQSMKSSESAALERFTSYVRNCMELLKTDKIEGEYGIIKTRKNPLSVNITDDKLIDSKYKVVTQSINIDKKQLADDLKSGKKIKGAELKRNPVAITFGG